MRTYSDAQKGHPDTARPVANEPERVVSDLRAALQQVNELPWFIK
jgi:hypothetical protein